MSASKFEKEWMFSTILPPEMEDASEGPLKDAAFTAMLDGRDQRLRASLAYALGLMERRRAVLTDRADFEVAALHAWNLQQLYLICPSESLDDVGEDEGLIEQCEICIRG